MPENVQYGKLPRIMDKSVISEWGLVTIAGKGNKKFLPQLYCGIQVMRNDQELIQHGSTDRWHPNQKRNAMNDRNGSS